MNLKILEESKKRMLFEIEGEDHTFCNALKRELNETQGVSVATYTIDHPLLGVPRFLVETTSVAPQEALKTAAESLKKQWKEFKKEVGAKL